MIEFHPLKINNPGDIRLFGNEVVIPSVRIFTQDLFPGFDTGPYIPYQEKDRRYAILVDVKVLTEGVNLISHVKKDPRHFVFLYNGAFEFGLRVTLMKEPNEPMGLLKSPKK